MEKEEEEYKEGRKGRLRECFSSKVDVVVRGVRGERGDEGRGRGGQ